VVAGVPGLCHSLNFGLCATGGGFEPPVSSDLPCATKTLAVQSNRQMAPDAGNDIIHVVSLNADNDSYVVDSNVEVGLPSGLSRRGQQLASYIGFSPGTNALLSAWVLSIYRQHPSREQSKTTLEGPL